MRYFSPCQTEADQGYSAIEILRYFYGSNMYINTAEEISGIPSREELLSKLLGSIQSPITNFARVIKQIAEKDGEAAPAEEAPAEA